MIVWVKVIYTIYNGIQQEQIIPFSRPGDKSGTKWLSKPREGQQVQFPCIQGVTELPSGVGDWLTWVWSHIISVLSQLIGLKTKQNAHENFLSKI